MPPRPISVLPRRKGLALLAIAASVFVAASGSATADPASSHEQKAGASAARYWTPERLGEAEPRALRSISGRVATRRSAPAAHGRPGARPPRILDSNAAGHRGIEPYGTYEVTDPLAYPNVTTGKIFARDRGGKYTCSGTVVNSRSNNILFTAAHCVRSRSFGWARRLIFIPAYREGAAPRGRWNAKTLYVPPKWTSSRFDYAAVKLQRRGGRNIEARTGSTGFAWNQAYEQNYRALGYPGNLANGRRMIGCFSPLATIDGSMGAPAPIGINCGMRSGSSGGGWLIDDDGFLASVVSYFYTGEPGVLYGPHFTKHAIKLLRWAERD